ncbi:peptidoglycan-binding domain-containing protein, partial [Vibrio cholerae]|uniref:peptidoglycan-binding domain-containing protein n=1 Tax=Vibrio cholerae TaxID=666 RepID=UPI0011D5E762
AINLNAGGSAGSGSAYGGQLAAAPRMLAQAKPVAELVQPDIAASMQSGAARVIDVASLPTMMPSSANNTANDAPVAEEKTPERILKSDLLKPSDELEKLAKRQASSYRQGNHSDEVKLLQEALIELGFDLGKAGADGDFGSKTKTAIEQFQKSYQPSHQTHPSYSIGAVDGIVGKGTLLALDEALMDGWQVVSATQINWADSKFGILLGSVESKNDYSAYNKTKGGLKSFYRTNLDKMTIVEVLKKQESRDIFAAGRFQLIPDTLKDAINKLSIDTSLVFDKNIQDKIFNEYLIRVKRPEISEFLESTGSVEDAMYAWAKEFASAAVEKGRPISKKRIAIGGESYYSGDGLNKAHLSIDEMRKVLIQTKQDRK